jgi:mono/diheme cytochrome c family protein
MKLKSSALRSRASRLAALSLVSALSASAAVDFQKEVVPILQQRCVECHGAEKQKGKLRLDTKADFFKGGKDGEIVKAGAAADSEFYKRLILPKDNDERMPPKGDALTAPQIETLKNWINEGAKWPDGMTVPAPAPTTAAAPVVQPVDDGWKPSGKVKPAVPAPELPKDFKAPAGEAAAIEALSKSGIDVRPVALNAPWHEVNLRLLGTNVTDASIAPLKDIPSLIEVRLGTTKITDKAIATLKALPHLEVLGLELTGVTDAGVAELNSLKNLTYLNLYGTKVTDKALDALTGLKHLRNLYLWQTEVTTNGVDRLQAALPGLNINTGWELIPVPASTNAPAAKK